VIVDTHVHVIADDEARYPLQASGLTEPWYREEPCPVERLLGLMDEGGVDRVVLVQGISAYGFDNRYTLDAAARHPGRCTAVVAVDRAAPDAAAELARLVDTGGARGLRWWGIADGGVMEPQDLWNTAGARELPVVVTILPDALPAFVDAVPTLPPVPLALDHCGFVDYAAGIPDVLRALAAHERVHLKVSTIALESAAGYGDERDFVCELVACFGASRLMWGSDYPHTHHVPYPELVEYARLAMSRLDDDDRALLLGHSALALWPELAR
jgi:L-fuconolactonase